MAAPGKADAITAAASPISQPPESPGVPQTLLKEFRISTRTKTAIGAAISPSKAPSRALPKICQPDNRAGLG